jgi:CO/xanthine dehydrogenase FAD-binding subunit
VDASIELTGPAGTRLVSWDDFFAGVKKTNRAEDELITAVVLPDRLPDRHHFAKVGTRNAMVIATVCAVVTRDHDHRTTVALGSVAPTPMRAKAAEEMISSVLKPTERDLGEFQRLVASEVRPITDHRSTEQYRRHAAGVIARRLLERCLS